MEKDLKLVSGSDLRGVAVDLGSGVTLGPDQARSAAYAFAEFLKKRTGQSSPLVALGRDPRLTGEALRVPRDRSQRPACGCAASVDIGAYDSCLHGCAYCYANHGRAVDRLAALHDPDSPLLLGRVDPAVDVVRDAPAPSYRTGQTGLF